MSDSTAALNIALVGPYTSGKTTLLESMLFVSGAIGRKGKVTDGNTVGDWSDEARARQSSVEVNAASFEYKDRRFTVLDCPGSIEFFAETANALMGADVAVIVCTPDLNRVWTMGRLLKFLAQHGIPHVLFTNRMDETAVRIAELIEAVQPVSDRPLVPCQVAIRDGDNVTGYVDLITGEAYEYRDREGAVGVDEPDSVSERREDARTQLLESLADFDDALLERLLEDEIPEPAEIQAYLRGVLADASVVPVLMGSADRDWGVRRLLDSLTDFAPGDTLAARRLPAGADGASVGQVIKTYLTQHGGKVSLARVWAGTIEDGTTLNDGQRIGGMYRMQGQQQTKIDKAHAGDIVGLGRLETIATGDTVAPADGPQVGPLPRAVLPSSVYSYSVRASRREDEVKVSGAMSRLAQEDPSLRFAPNPDTQEAVLWGQGEMHLKVALDRLAGKYGLAMQTERPKVAYKEAIRKPVAQHARFKKQTGGHGQFGDVHIEVKPLPRGSGFEFQDKVVGGAVPAPVHSGGGSRGSRLSQQWAARLPGRRRFGDTDRRQAPFRRQLGDGLQDRWPHGDGRSAAKMQSGAAGAHLRGQDLGAERVHAQRPAAGDRPPWAGARLPGTRGLVGLGRGHEPDASGGDARSHHRAPFAHPGRRHLRSPVRPPAGTHRAARR